MASPAEILQLAAQYQATGNSALAEQLAQSVLAQEQDHAGALHLLGVIAWQNGNLHDAMAYLRRSLTADPSNGVVWQHSGDVLLADGDVHGGITYYEQALRLRPDFAEGYNTLGLALMRVGKLAQAVDAFQQARRLAPSFAQALNNLGVALNQQGRWAEAVAVFEDALKLRPDSPEVLYNLANAYYYQGDRDAAIACYRRTLAARPANAAEVLNSLATALRKQGQRDEAIAQYQEALRVRPGHPMVLYHLSEMAAQGQYTFSPEELSRLKELLVSGRCGEEERRFYTFAVAKVLDGQGAFDDAFRYYREANELLLRQFKKRNASFNARAHATHIERIIAAFGPAYFEKVKDGRTPAEQPVFVVGLPCSGTALVTELLAVHPRVAGVGEAGSVLRFLAPSRAASDVAADPGQLLPDTQTTRTAAANYRRHLAQLDPGAVRVIVNSVDNIASLGLVATLFSGARVLYCRREPLAVGLACYFQNRRDLPFACSLSDLGTYIRAHEKLMGHWARVLPLAIQEVDYDALVHDRGKTIRELLAFCDLDWDEHCATARPPYDSEPIGRSQKYRAHLEPLVKALEG
jgi:tetratricopeptide (TPR) repeat protein